MRCFRILVAVVVATVMTTMPAVAADGADFTLMIDRTWILIGIALVALMQVGFLLLECGLVRAKTTINVAQKNLTDFMVSVGAFWLIGFAVMFGASIGGWFGASGDLLALNRLDTDTVLFFTFQAMFCGTAATIVSGAIAERCAFWAYTAIAIAIGVLVYPVFGHWAWGSALIGDNETLLGQFGFHDFAGSTVVHATGAWVAMAAIMVIGPRLGRFHEDGTPNMIPGHNPVLSGAGAIILLVGWIGFNGGSALGMSEGVAQIVANTVIAAVFGGVGGLAYGLFTDGGKLQVERSINGVLGGLVAVTAGADVFGMQASAVVGIAGGLIAQYANYFVLYYLRLDDVVGVIGVHGFAGALGTILVAVFAPADALAAGGRLSQLAVQVGGVVLNCVWAFGATYLIMKVLVTFMNPRVAEEDEIEGLNTVEHGQTLGTGHLQQMMVRMLEGKAEDGELLRVEQGDESGELSELFNLLTLRMQADQLVASRKARHDLQEMELRKEKDDELVAQINAMIETAANGRFDDRLKPMPGASEVLLSACEGVNRLFDAVDLSTKRLGSALERLAAGDLGYVMAEDEAGKFGDIARNFNSSVQRFREAQDASTSTMRRMTDESRRTANEADTALRDIETASDEALKIISIIEDIASKTNVLALNASIEASRAGQQGAAFAVVAGQVQSLAKRVSGASSDINRIIRSNADKVGSGIIAVMTVRDTLASIDKEIANLAENVEQKDRHAA